MDIPKYINEDSNESLGSSASSPLLKKNDNNEIINYTYYQSMGDGYTTNNDGDDKYKDIDDDEDEDINHEYSFVRQFKALFLKNIAYQKRQYKTNILQALVPVLMISIMCIVDIATPPIKYTDNSQPYSLPLPYIFPPKMNLTVPYLADSTDVMGLGACCQNQTGFLGLFTTENQVSPTPSYPSLGSIPTQDFTFYQYPTQEEMDSVSYKQGRTDNKFLLGYDFRQLEIVPGGSCNADMVTYSNDSINSAALINIMNNAIFQSLTGEENQLLTGVKTFPYYAYTERKDMIQPQENFWYLFMLSFCMVVFVCNVVYEKEHRLRESMKMAGLRMKIYWLVQYIFNFALVVVIVFVTIGFAYLLKFRFFTQTSFTVYLVLFLLFGLTQISFAFFISVFFSSVYTATVVSFIYIIFTALSANLLNNAFIMNPDTSLATFIITGLIPHVAFHRAVSYISLAYIGNSPGLTWSDIFAHHQMPTLYGLLFGEFLLYGLLHLYLEMVIPSVYGVKYHPLFFFKPSFWRSKSNGNTIVQPAKYNKGGSQQDYNSGSSSSVDMVPPDVLEEARYTYSRENTASIRLMNLSKHFKVGKSTTVAVDQLTLTVEKGQCFGILGPNGSGKTTTLSILSGLYAASSGTAIIEGHNISRHITRAQQSMGVCPQDDVLWLEMSGREHLLFFGRMKNLQGKLLDDMVDKALAEVMLTDAQDKAVGEYSGGMKRRLSLAIALIGSPSAILLDEPTTGVDPFSRRIVWDVITSYKSKCAIILTTHNMEEAEILCDRVCIINRGAMKCIGRSGDLKTRYGAGHTLSISTTTLKSNIHEYITELIPEVKLIHEISTTKTYAVPRHVIKMSYLFKSIQENKSKYFISDWGICQASLEEVLLQAAHGDDKKNNETNNNNNNNNNRQL